VVAVGHVTQRDAVEGEAKLVLVEAADGDARRPFVVAERISRLEVHAGQLLDSLERAGARCQDLELCRANFLYLLRLTLAEHDDLGALVRSLGALFGGVGGESRSRDRKCQQAGAQKPDFPDGMDLH